MSMSKNICRRRISNRRRRRQRILWSTINKIIGPPTATHSQHSATDFATHFVNKVERIRSGTAAATDLEVVSRPSTSLSSFRSVTTEEVHQLLRKSLCKQCTLDPAPTWLVKRASHVLAPVINAICNSSLQSGFLPESQKHRLSSQLVLRSRLLTLTT